MNKVEVKCQGAASVPLEKLVPFQGELKTLSDVNYAKLKKDILELGFSEPISIWAWQDKAYILNGHQRLSTLTKMKDEGFQVPEIPVNLVEASSLSEAKRKVLSLTSQFGEMNPQGLFDFIQETDIKFEDLQADFRFPEMDMVDFKEKFFNTPDSEPDPWAEPEQEPSKDPPEGERSRANRISMRYSADEFKALYPMVEKGLKELSCENTAELFKKLLEMYFQDHKVG